MILRTLRKIMLMAAAACAFTLAAADAYTIYPIPHAQIAGKAACSLSATTTVIAESGIDQPTKNRLCDVLKQHGIVAEFAAKPSKTNANIYLGVNGSKGDADRLAKKLKLKRDIFANGKFDRHIISLTAQKNGNAQLLILGENTDAVFFALASLEQMLDGGSSNMACVTIYDYADIKDRGVVEGYYGVPYSTAVTEDLLRFMMRYKMNSYMYGAKSDPYHSGYWGKPYPEKLTAEQKSMGCFTAADIKQMCEVSVATKVNFIWAIHPGVAFTGNDDAVIDRIMEKFEAMHGLGVRQFGVFVDDVGVPYDEPTLKLNAKRLTDLQNAIDKKWNFSGAVPADTVKPLHFVPQLYAYGWTKAEGRKNFFSALSNTPAKTQIYITGKAVWSVPNNTDLKIVEEDLGRPVAWWWNYPCNDNADAYTFPVDMYSNFIDMPAIDDDARLPENLEGCASLLCNPMQQGEIAKIPLFSAADYAWNNASFDNKTSWNAALAAAVGKQYAQPLAHILPYLRINDPESMAKLIEDYKTTGNASALKAELSAIIDDCNKVNTLSIEADTAKVLFHADIRPWLLKLRQTASVINALIDVAAMPAGNAKAQAYAQAAAEAKSLTYGAEFNVVALEGMAEGIGKQDYNARLANKNLTPFVEYMLKKAK